MTIACGDSWRIANRCASAVDTERLACTGTTTKSASGPGPANHSEIDSNACALMPQVGLCLKMTSGRTDE